MLPKAVFGPEAPVVPLVPDIAVQMRLSVPATIPDIVIQRFIASWRRRPDYKAAVASGAPRHNLNGTVCWEDQMRAVEELLIGSYPHLFGPDAPTVPLAIGIFQQILEAHREHPAMSTKRLRLFVSRQTRRRRYLEAIVRGERRVALDGTKLDPPTESEREHAAGEIERRFGGVFMPDAMAAE